MNPTPTTNQDTNMDIETIDALALPIATCTCGEPLRVAPNGFTARHRTAGPCYVQPHDDIFNAVWDAIKDWDIQRLPGDGYAGATGDDVCTILEALGSV